MVEGRIAGFSAAKSLGLKVDQSRFDNFWTRLDHLRAGEVGAKIRSGIDQVRVDGWEA
jgi:sarcosine oxidase subunit alpha